MKINSPRLAALFLTACICVVAAPLTVTTAVHTRPDIGAPAITNLPAGTEPVPTTNLNALASTPAGWMAIDLPGPFEGYVENKDLAKSLDVKVGAPIRSAPKTDAPVLTIAEKSDKTTITGLRGKWTQISLERKLVGYIKISGAAPSATASTPSAAHAPTPAPRPSSTTSTPPPMSPAPVTPGAYGRGTAGQPAPMVNLGDGGAATLPRQFAGRFVSTRRPFTPRRPFDYALNDDAGKRYAYLDVSKLLQTDQIEKYVDHSVVVFGAAKATPDGRDIVIQVETLQLK